jgi:hypothetical protein
LDFALSIGDEQYDNTIIANRSTFSQFKAMLAARSKQLAGTPTLLRTECPHKRENPWESSRPSAFAASLSRLSFHTARTVWRLGADS